MTVKLRLGETTGNICGYCWAEYTELDTLRAALWSMAEKCCVVLSFQVNRYYEILKVISVIFVDPLARACWPLSVHDPRTTLWMPLVCWKCLYTHYARRRMVEGNDRLLACVSRIYSASRSFCWCCTYVTVRRTGQLFSSQAIFSS
jgi:hypothetical protein